MGRPPSGYTIYVISVLLWCVFDASLVVSSLFVRCGMRWKKLPINVWTKLPSRSVCSVLELCDVLVFVLVLGVRSKYLPSSVWLTVAMATSCHRGVLTGALEVDLSTACLHMKLAMP